MQPAQLRVALFSGNYNYVRDGANGAQNRLVGHLLSLGAAVRVYSPAVERPAFPPTGDLVPVPSLSGPAGRSEYRLALGMPAAIRRDAEEFAPNLVHLSAPDILGHRALSWARARGIPAVAAVHTRFETYPDYYHLGALRRPLERLLARFYDRAELVLTPTPSVSDVLRGWGVSRPFAAWTRGVDHSRFRPSARDMEWRRSLGLADDELAVAFVGRLVKEKGLGIFAEVSAALGARGVRHRVLAVGDGPARDWFAACVPDAVFAGFQSGDALGRAVASADVFFNPSATETWGQVTSEAMAAGLPVVGADATGTRDLVVHGETGFLVPPRDAGAYADAIARIAADPSLRARLGAAGQARAAGWRWDAANAGVVDAYLGLLSA